MEWKNCKISDLGKIVTGKTPKTAIKENYGGDFPFLSPSDNMGQKHISKTAKTLTILGKNEVKKSIIPCGSVCVSCIGSDLGKVVISGREMVTNQQINSIIPNKENDGDFIYYLMSIVGKKLNFLSKTSTAIPIVNKSTFSNTNIRIPVNLSDQRKIVGILSALDSKIENNNKINANLEAQAQALFKSWFVDFTPFKDQPFVDSELGPIPQGWKVGKADDFYKINIGKTPPRKEKEWFSKNESDNKWISISDMGNCGLFISNSAEKLTNAAIKKFNISLVPVNTILLSFKLTIGRVAISDCDLTTNEAIARFILPDECYLEFSFLMLKLYNYSTLGSTSSIATAVNSKIIKSMKMVMPSQKVLEDFHTITNPLFERIRFTQKENQRLAALRDTLLPKLMSGEIKL